MPLESTIYALSAFAEGFQPTTGPHGLDVTLGSGEAKTGLDIVLSPGGARLAGHVFDATGGPISGATIRVLRRVVPHETTVTRSAADGSFAVWMTKGPVTILAEASGYAPIRMAHVAPSSDLVLRLAPGSTVSGRVVAEGTAVPVAGVRVRAIAAGYWNDPTRPSAISDDDGAFEVRGLDPDRYVLVGEGSGWRGELKSPVEVGLAGRVDGVSLTVSRAAVVTGKVVQRGSGEPCSRGSVTFGPLDAAPSPGPPMGRSAATVPMIIGSIEADGTARVAAVPAGSYQVDVQCADAFVAEGPQTLQVEHDDIDGLVWKVDPGSRMVVHAVDEAEQPAANVRLVLLGQDASDAAVPDAARRRLAPLRSFTTGLDGAYELTGLSPGVYTVEPGPEHKGQPVSVDARRPDRNRIEATVHLEGRGRIVVTVRAPEGSGVDQVEVRAAPVADAASPPAPSPERSPNQATSASSAPRPAIPRVGILATAIGDGQFEIGPLAAGAYRVTASDGINPPREPGDWSQGIVRVGAGVARATVVLARGGALSGRVMDSAGHALPDAWVTADCKATAGPGGPRSSVRIPGRAGATGGTISDDDGRFRIDRIANDARCTVRAEKAGGGGVGVARDVRAGGEAIIRIPELGSLRGTALLPDGTPVTAFQLSVRGQDGGTRSENVTTTDGHWSLSRVVPGPILLLAFDPSRGDAQTRVDLAPGEQREGVALVFQPPSPLAATMERGDRHP